MDESYTTPQPRATIHTLFTQFEDRTSALRREHHERIRAILREIEAAKLARLKKSLHR